MTENSFSSIDFARYFQLLRDMLPGAQGFGVSDPNGRMLSHSEGWPGPAHGCAVDTEQFHAHVGEVCEPPRPVKWADEGAHLARFDVRSRFGDTVGSLMVAHEQSYTGSPATLHRVVSDALAAVGGCLETEYRLTVELDAMARELAARYEELNLVYVTNDDVTHHEQESAALNQLVTNCVEYLDVGMVALLFPKRKKIFYAVNEREPIREALAIAHELQGEFCAWIETRDTCIVMNDFADQLRASVCPGVPYKILGCPVRDGAGEITGTLVTLNHNHRTDFLNSDRNLLEAMSRKASKIIQANYDALTGLMKQRGLHAVLAGLLASVQERDECHCYLNLDIDQLQVLNDTHGRQAGDTVLRSIADYLRDTLRTTDTLAYLGEGKYGVVLERCSIEQGVKRAESLRQAIEAKEYGWEGKKIPVSISVGMAAIEPGVVELEGVLEAAEMARDTAKESGRNRIQVFSQNDAKLAERKEQMQWVTRIHNALHEDRFRIFCQTIQASQPGSEAYHCEILLRLFDEKGDMVSPASFIPAAERYHLMPAIDRWVISKTCALLAEYGLAQEPEQGMVSINLSGQSLGEEALVTHIREQVFRHGLEPSCLCFEITETAAVANIDLASKLILDLKASGFRFSLDDFGTGLSSFAYLKALPVDFLKIDGAFIKQIVDDPVAHTMVSSINDIGHVMNLKTVAEFVENDALKACLQQMGVDYLQGYGIGKPLPIEEYVDSLSAVQSA